MTDSATRQRHAERAADALVNSLKHALDDPSLHARQIDIALAGAEQQPYHGGKGARRVLRFDVADEACLKGRLHVKNHGGNVYRVSARLAEGEEMQWETCIPELNAPHDTLQKHTGDVARDVLFEIERLYGERAMQAR